MIFPIDPARVIVVKRDMEKMLPAAGYVMENILE